jgi:hypothetical protein
MKMRRLRIVVASVAALAIATPVATPVMASPTVCDSFLSSYSIACPFNSEGLQQSAMVGYTNFITLVAITQMLSQQLLLGQRGLRAGLSDQTGMPAQAGGGRWNGWLGFARNDQANKFTPANSSGDTNVLLGGVDYTFRNNVVFGVALSFDKTNLNMPFTGGTFDSEGWSVAPYIAWPLTRSLLLDASIGFGSSDLKTNTTIPFAIPAATTVDDRWFGSVSLSHVSNFDKLQLVLKGSLLHSEDKTKAFFSPGIVGPIGMPDTAYLTQLRLGGTAAYDAGGGWQPYLGLTYINDTQRETLAVVGAPNDRDAWNVAVGINYYSKGAVSAGIQLNGDFDRQQTRNNQFLANISIRF